MKQIISLFTFVVFWLGGLLSLVLGASCNPFPGWGSSSATSSASSHSEMIVAYMGYFSGLICGRVLDSQTSSAIANLRVSLLSSNTYVISTTDTNGSFQFNLRNATAGIYQLTIEDMDGTNNGSYSYKTLPVEENSAYFDTDLGNIPLDRTTN